MTLTIGRFVICGSLFVTASWAQDVPTVVIGAPESQGPAVIIDLGAIDEALGRPAASRLKLHPPSAVKKVTDASVVQLHLPAAMPKKVKPVAAENAPAVPAAEIQKAELKPEPPKTEAAKIDTPKVETPPPVQMASLPTAPKALTPTPAAPPPAATPAAAPPPPAAPVQTAAIPAAPKPALPERDASTVPQGTTRVLFATETDQLQDLAHSELDALASKIKSGDQRVQIIAYASGSADQSSAARRLSLKRALTIREYLMGKGIRSTRMDVRALGNQSGEGPPDRVDIVPDAH